MLTRLTILAILLSAAGFSASIDLVQGGWSGGGPLVISFTGLDTNIDGTLQADELTHFAARWTAPDQTLTHWGVSNIEPSGFHFTDVGNFLLFLRNDDYSLVDTAFEGEYLATVFDSQLFPVDTTIGSAEAVPEPGSFGIISTLAAAALFRRRLRRR